MNKRLLPLLTLPLLISACGDHSGSSGTTTSIDEPVTDNAPPAISYTVLNAMPHDTTSYTEGFLFHDGKLYESSGAPEDKPHTRSMFGEVDLKTGKITAKAELDRKTYFGEGISFLNGKAYQLTWTNKVGFIYDAKTFKRIGQFTIPNAEGWGMTTDGSSLILSDGSSNLTFLDPQTFKILKIVGVKDNNGPVGNINELEYIKGSVYANIYQTSDIIRIDPASGMVTGKADFSQLDKQAKNKYAEAEYMNGIAYDSATNKVYVTGKLWPEIYEVRFNN
ncbi:MAG TPA: glutaminyl-peptide cyclotransferase [Puia sp.]|nr:glutaminyl-peptide cyclotransferase [Puia sp.]